MAGLRGYPLLAGFRGRPPAGRAALVDPVMAVAAFAESRADDLVELDVNPILVRPESAGAVAVDAVIRLGKPAS